MSTLRKPKLAVWKFASCDGCQLTLLNCQEEFLQLAERFEIAYFLSEKRKIINGPYDLSLVEGSISIPRDTELIKEVRRMSKKLITIGACASAGGIQALRNYASAPEYAAIVYPHPEFIQSLAKSRAIAEYVPVDFELHGCPVDKKQLLEVISAFLEGRRPVIPTTSVCLECKRKGIACGLVVFGPPCMGPVTQGGCDALCPTYHRGCFGCYGPKETPNPAALTTDWQQRGMKPAELKRLFRHINAGAEAFAKESQRHE
jgi:sulfhydrogenase subunit delta